MHLKLKDIPLSILWLASGSLAALDGHCPPLGPVIPAPKHPGTDPAIQAALAAFNAILQEFNSQARLNETALAIGIKSIHEEGKLFEYVYTPPEEFRDPRGVQEVDSDTVFRIASASKVSRLIHNDLYHRH